MATRAASLMTLAFMLGLAWGALAQDEPAAPAEPAAQSAGLPRGVEWTFNLDELSEAETGSRLWGANYELHVGDRSTFGATCMRWFAHRDVAPTRDGMSVYNARAYAAALPRHEALSVEFEYAHERNADVLWWQEEIAGEYFQSNANLVSHQGRLHTAPTKRLATGVIAYRFLADQPASYGPGVADRDIGIEVDAYADWTINDNFTLSLVGAGADPGGAVRQATDRTSNFALGLVYLAYKY